MNTLTDSTSRWSGRGAKDGKGRRLGFAAAAIAAGLMVAPGVQARPAPESFADLVQEVAPAVVSVTTRSETPTVSMNDPRRFQMPDLPDNLPFPFRDFFERFQDQPGQPGQPMPPRMRQGAGTGFILDSDGTIVTNNHVVEGASEITVTLNDGRELPAELLGRDEKTDLAVLRVETGEELPHVEFGDSDTSRVGDWVLAVGNPFGLGGTVTAGIISANGRDLRSGPYDDYLQIDAPINRGNSGGPLFDVSGKVIGINTAIFSPNGGSIGIGFAIPSALAKPIVEQLRESGEVERGWLGVYIQGIDPDLAEGLGLEQPEGALVTRVTEGSPAEAAGVRQGDVVLKYGSTEITELRDLTRAVAQTKIGSRETLSVWRDGEQIALDVKIGEMPASDKVAAAETPQGKVEGGTVLGSLGLNLAELDGRTRAAFSIDEEVDGVVVTDVDQSKVAAEQGIRPGDVISAVNNDKVNSPAEVAAKVKEAESAKRKAVVFLIERQGQERYVALRLQDA